jgi:hypothetical protein
MAVTQFPAPSKGKMCLVGLAPMRIISRWANDRACPTTHSHLRYEKPSPCGTNHEGTHHE